MLVDCKAFLKYMVRIQDVSKIIRKWSIEKLSSPPGTPRTPVHVSTNWYNIQVYTQAELF